ncbi:acyl carrier protein [Pseudomonas sp. Fl5BN2]|uniref:acyl carrier protein n=1 Tax=unclassified Pseudomonas TaxID=196821 RepID=UPI00137910B9|nr:MULTISPECIES: acyl carrier protein [unclassified Pseudomonas]NBF01525.1 acyl carrier protein [Pseudomonas sp. Fl5BN2]NBF08416.1 acyl carrier protein [Pseudomonas sp. Fl4BN1]
MDRFDIQQSIRHAIEAQMALKWSIPSCQALSNDTYSLDLKALLHSLECEFNVRLDPEHDLYWISSINDLSQFILEKTRRHEPHPSRQT